MYRGNPVVPSNIAWVRYGTHMTPTFDRAFGYKGDRMRLPVRDIAEALPFYERVLGFQLVSRSDTPERAAILARDAVEIGLAENGGDPSQDGCAFHVTGVDALFAEFQTRGVERISSETKIERHQDVAWNVFYVVAPDGLCYWFGERKT